VADDIREELADWLGAQDFARTVRTITDDAATEVRVDVEVLADMLLASPVIARIRAEALLDAAQEIEPDVDPELCTTVYDPWDVGELLRTQADRLSIREEADRG
jgi:hypothetical protein